MRRVYSEKKTLRLLLLLVALTCLLCTPATAQEEKELTLWIYPYLPATELVQRFTPLADYLAAELKQPVRVKIQKSYQSHVDFVGQDQADLAYMGPASYVLLRRKYGAKPLLARLEESGASFFHGVIVVRQDSPLTSLAQLKGKSFAFGDSNSTTGHIVPRAMLAEAGVPVTQLGSYDFLNSHKNVALAVLGGYFDAGAIRDEFFTEYEKQGLRALATSPPMPEHLFLVRSTLPPALIERLRTLLAAISSSPRKQEILSSIKKTATGLVPTEPRDYDDLEKLIRLSGSE